MILLHLGIKMFSKINVWVYDSRLSENKPSYIQKLHYWNLLCAPIPKGGGTCFSPSRPLLPPLLHFKESQRLTDGHRDKQNVFGPHRYLKPLSNIKFLVPFWKDEILQSGAFSLWKHLPLKPSCCFSPLKHTYQTTEAGGSP